MRKKWPNIETIGNKIYELIEIFREKSERCYVTAKEIMLYSDKAQNLLVASILL